MSSEVDIFYTLAEKNQLETDRLYLRPCSLNDVQNMFEYASDEATTAFVFPTHQTIDDTKRALSHVFLKDPLGKYAIELKQTNKMIGTIDLRINEEQRSAELGYVLNKQYWGKGLMPEAAEALLQLGFEELKLIRIHALHDKQNSNSGRVMKKIGMQWVGEVPNARLHKGKYITEVWYNITYAQYEQKMFDKIPPV